MRRLALLALALGLAVLAGTARADTFAVVPTPPATSSGLADPQLLGLWQRAGSAYGIPWQVLAAINKVESDFGRNTGPSSAGAIGWMQFMPDTWLRWGVDANGDGVADPWSPDDAIFSAARYLAAAGGATDLYRSVYAYNHADWYVQEVLSLADLYGADSTIAFSLDRLQQRLDDARRSLAAVGEQVGAAQRRLAASERAVARWRAGADAAPLLSTRLVLEQRAGEAAARRDAASARLRELTVTLGGARRELARAQQQSAAASFTPAASQLLAAPTYSSGYVFPVGGGPGVVFASHAHHDYPAVDIAAPLGSPLYALADATVVRAWSAADGACGIGFTMRTGDGRDWTYCHLSVLDAGVVAGAVLTAGREVGLVGETGDATGPHLHLQLQPASGWPQREPWFESFAGRAFTWSDAGSTEPARTLASVSAPGPVFAIVPTDVVYFSRP